MFAPNFNILTSRPVYVFFSSGTAKIWQILVLCQKVNKRTRFFKQFSNIAELTDAESQKNFC